MPLPKEDTTPPVTKTYLVMGTLLRESAMITEEAPSPKEGGWRSASRGAAAGVSLPP
jgi:hypothetical protein